jgi:hypothetical protein
MTLLMRPEKSTYKSNKKEIQSMGLRPTWVTIAKDDSFVLQNRALRKLTSLEKQWQWTGHGGSHNL